MKDRLYIAVVSETYPPEVNGVAMTIGRMVQGLLARQHRVSLIRPRQAPASVASLDWERIHDTLVAALHKAVRRHTAAATEQRLLGFLPD